MTRHPLLVLQSVISLLAFACSSNPTPVLIPASNETIEAGTEMSLSGGSHVVYVYNHSSVRILVTGIHLVDCENIKNSCEVQRIRVPVYPGQRANIVIVRPSDPSRAYSFKFEFSWEEVREH